MEYLFRLMASARFIIAFIAPLIFIIASLSQALSIIKSRKIVVIKSTVKVFSNIVSLIMGLIMFCISSLSSGIGFVLGLSVSIYLLLIPIKSFFENIKAGLYEKGIIYINHSYIWSEIESYYIADGVIRLIHKDTGAFDIDNANNMNEGIIRYLLNIIELKKNEN